MNISEDISAKFANMGFVCVCLVVLMHVHCPWEGGGINQLAVPFFFVMSGFFLAAHVDEKGWYARALRKRLRSLVVPLFIWCVLWAFFTIPLAVALNMRSGRELYANLLTGWGAFRYLALDITRTPALGPLWYVRCLFLFVIISPVIVWLIKRTHFLCLLIFGGMYIAYSRLCGNVSFFSYGFSLEGLFYFAIGIYLRMRDFSLEIRPKMGIFLFGFGVFLFLMVSRFMSIAIMIVGLWGMIPSWRFPRVLITNTFPVYLVHMFVLLLFGNERIRSVPLAVGVGLSAIALSVFAAETIRRTMPRMSQFLWGGR